MRGLIEKDIRLTLIRKQTLVMFVAMALIMGFSMDGSFVVGYLTMFAMIVAIGTISYDEIDNGYSFLMTLPFDRKTYVKEKYLFTLILIILAWCLGIVLFGALCVMRHAGAGISTELPGMIAIIPVIYLSGIIMIPLQLKYGAEKSRIVLFIIFGFIAVMLYGSKTIFSSFAKSFAGFGAFLESMSPAVVILVLCAVCAAATFASYLWSRRIMEKKEF